jgi:hypothetical protein
MRTLSSADYLDLWERGSRLHPLDRGLLALSAAHTDTPYENLADWPLGRRNQALAELRCACFGPGLQGWILCPQCAEKLEFQLDGRTLMEESAGGEPIVVKGHSFRLPTSRDLARAAREADSRVGALRLLQSCCMEEGPAPDFSDEEL